MCVLGDDVLKVVRDKAKVFKYFFIVCWEGRERSSLCTTLLHVVLTSESFFTYFIYQKEKKNHSLPTTTTTIFTT